MTTLPVQQQRILEEHRSLGHFESLSSPLLEKLRDAAAFICNTPVGVFPAPANATLLRGAPLCARS